MYNTAIKKIDAPWNARRALVYSNAVMVSPCFQGAKFFKGRISIQNHDELKTTKKEE